MAIVTDWTLEQFLRLPETKPALEFECGRISQADCAYLAGVIDGEGCIRIQRWRFDGETRYQLRLQVTNTSVALRDWIISRFDGWASATRKPNGTIVWIWHCHDSKLEIVLRLVFPYLIVKRREALVGLAFRRAVAARYGTRRLTARQLVRQETCWRHIALLKYGNSPSRKGYAARNGVG
jgi:hypothetical protein